MRTTNSRQRMLAISKTLSYLYPYRRQLAYALLALVFTAGITLSLGQGVKLVIDEGFVAASEQQLGNYVLGFLVLVVALSVGTFTRYYWVTWLGERVIADIRQRVFNHLVELHPGFFEHSRSLEIQSRLTADTTLLQSVIGSSVSVALRNLIMLIGGTIWLFITNPKLTAIVLVAVPVVVAPILLFGRRVRKLSRTSQDRIADVGAYVGEVLGQIKTVQAYNHQAADKESFRNHVEEAFQVARQRTVQRALLIAVVICLVLGAVGGMLWVGGLDVIEGRISAGELAAFVFYSVIVGAAVGSLSEVVGELQRAAGAAERIVELLQTESLLLERNSPNHLAGGTSGKIAFQHLTFCYPSRPDTPALDDFSLTIAAGETIALVGPSGAGKSTLLDLLLRFYPAPEGAIMVNDTDIQQVPLEELRDQFALVSQSPSLFFGTIAHNIGYGKTTADRSDIIAAAKAAYAHDFIERLPDKYDTHLGDGGIGLSGGQRQRIAIARAILKDAPILLLDEATSALDAESEHWVQQALTDLMRNRTTLVIAHRLATVVSADRIVVVENGKIEAVGSHQELLEHSTLYRRLADLQFQTV